jgi:2,3-dihydroxybiphenyl 1,2-dioxygenase
MQLGFLEFGVRDPGAWDTFLTGVIGAVSAGQGRYRIDGHAWRFSIVEGRDDLATVGWELTHEELDAALGNLLGASVEVQEADPAERGARRRYRVLDPAGVPLELVEGLERATDPFESPAVRSGFVADDQGLGHLVVTAPDPAGSRAFYEGLLGFRFSDRIACTFHGHDVDLAFFHANRRHHSLAFGGQQRKRLHHFMVEARSMDDVGLAFDRTLASGLPIMQTLGRHPNDRMFSFYAQTPSRFQFEFGWGGREVDDAHWTPTTHDRISEWGHHPPMVFAPKERP